MKKLLLLLFAVGAVALADAGGRPGENPDWNPGGGKPPWAGEGDSVHPGEGQGAEGGEAGEPQGAAEPRCARDPGAQDEGHPEGAVVGGRAGKGSPLSRGQGHLPEHRGAAEEGWTEMQKSGRMTVEQRMKIRLAGTYAIHEVKEALDTLYDASGTSAIFPSTPFERRFRDIHTVAQQIQGRKSHLQTVGEWMFGASVNPDNMSVI